jgi:hypothetical protein
MGDWAKNISVTEDKYKGPTMTPSQAALRLFGWLAPFRSLPYTKLCKPLALVYWQNTL